MRSSLVFRDEFVEKLNLSVEILGVVDVILKTENLWSLLVDLFRYNVLDKGRKILGSLLKAPKKLSCIASFVY
jgi:hypothetical protein